MKSGHIRSVKERLQEIQSALGGHIRTSSRGVPHVILPGHEQYSVCYFVNSNSYRTWIHCGLPTNERYMDFKTAADVIEHFSKQTQGASQMKITHEEPASGYSRMHVGDLKPGDVYVNGTHNPDRLNKGFALYMLLNSSTSNFITCNADFRYAVNLRNGNVYQHETSMCVWLANAETKFSIIKD